MTCDGEKACDCAGCKVFKVMREALEEVNKIGLDAPTQGGLMLEYLSRSIAMTIGLPEMMAMFSMASLNGYSAVMAQQAKSEGQTKH